MGGTGSGQIWRNTANLHSPLGRGHWWIAWSFDHDVSCTLALWRSAWRSLGQHKRWPREKR